MTVSRVIRGEPQVRPETRARVVEIMRELGRRRSESALRAGRGGPAAGADHLLGAEAVRTLVALIESPEKASSIKKTIRPSLIVRDSTGGVPFTAQPANRQ